MKKKNERRFSIESDIRLFHQRLESEKQNIINIIQNTYLTELTTVNNNNNNKKNIYNNTFKLTLLLLKIRRRSSS